MTAARSSTGGAARRGRVPGAFRPALVCVLLPALAGAPGASARADQIVLRDGRTLNNVEVVRETIEAVTYRISGVEQTEPAANIREVVHSDEPLGYREAMRHLEAGRFVEAATAFERAAGGGGGGWVKQYALFHAAEAWRQAGRNQEAAERYQQLLREVPDTRFLPAARLGLGLCQLQAGNFEAARQAFAELAAAAQARGFGAQWKHLAELHIAESYEREGQLGQALERYRRIAREAVTDPEAQALARLGAIRCGGGELQDRLAELKELIDAARTPERVRAQAYLLQGQLQAHKGAHEEALLSFLRVAYDPPFRAFATLRAEALFRAAEAFERARTAEWQARAEALRRELRETFPGSEWARRLQ
ncbi:MAG: hypothetical protein KatS3mg102_2436 [Planctomycetota bacterium]|nr:MAG: hypothetical protein KatS3mg102_2436 [Planctomycetota bacterium]